MSEGRKWHGFRTCTEPAERGELSDVFDGGSLVYEPPALEAIRGRTVAELASLPEGVRRRRDPVRHPVGLEPSLGALELDLMNRRRKAEK